MPDGPVDAGRADEVAAAFHAEHKALYGYDFAGDATQQVEWVNLRVSGIGPIQRPEIQRSSPVARGRRSCAVPRNGRRDGGLLRRGGRVRRHAGRSGAPTSPPGTVVTGPAIIEEFGSTVPLHPGFTARVDEYLNIIVTEGASA